MAYKTANSNRRQKKINSYAVANKPKITETRYAGTEWSGEEDFIVEIKDKKDTAEIWIAHPDRVKRGEVEKYAVIYEGALDFEGNKQEFRKRYPDYFKLLKENNYIK